MYPLVSYLAINATIPEINITSIATYSNHRAKPGNNNKIIKKIIARPTNEPPLACCVSTIFSPPILILI